jgi:hypothetical protein
MTAVASMTAAGSTEAGSRSRQQDGSWQQGSKAAACSMAAAGSMATLATDGIIAAASASSVDIRHIDVVIWHELWTSFTGGSHAQWNWKKKRWSQNYPDYWNIYSILRNILNIYHLYPSYVNSVSIMYKKKY